MEFIIVHFAHIHTESTVHTEFALDGHLAIATVAPRLEDNVLTDGSLIYFKRNLNLLADIHSGAFSIEDGDYAFGIIHGQILGLFLTCRGIDDLSRFHIQSDGEGEL